MNSAHRAAQTEQSSSKLEFHSIKPVKKQKCITVLIDDKRQRGELMRWRVCEIREAMHACAAVAWHASA